MQAIEKARTRDGYQQLNDVINLTYLDGKWFYDTEHTARFYLLLNKMPPIRTVNSKLFIIKVIFTTLVVAPRHDVYQNKLFGKTFGNFFLFSEIQQEMATLSNVRERWKPK